MKDDALTTSAAGFESASLLVAPSPLARSGSGGSSGSGGIEEAELLATLQEMLRIAKASRVADAASDVRS